MVEYSDQHCLSPIALPLDQSLTPSLIPSLIPARNLIVPIRPALGFCTVEHTSKCTNSSFWILWVVLPALFCRAPELSEHSLFLQGNPSSFDVRGALLSRRKDIDVVTHRTGTDTL